MAEKQTVYIIQNQHRQYLDKHGRWHSGQEPRLLFRSHHQDEALNTLIELNAKDIELRGQVISATLDQKNHPVVEVCPDAIALDKAAAISQHPDH